jgi:hypothetical protein
MSIALMVKRVEMRWSSAAKTPMRSCLDKVGYPIRIPANGGEAESILEFVSSRSSSSLAGLSRCASSQIVTTRRCLSASASKKIGRLGHELCSYIPRLCG